MMKKAETSKGATDKLVKNIRRKTCQTYSAEEKIRIVLAGLRGEESISVLCQRAGIAESLRDDRVSGQDVYSSLRVAISAAGYCYCHAL
uniref:transposase n=1 Tax=Roseovarius sp. BRH_c41 TaxID=1629709 RepID=UPI000A6F228A|nr:transposase [Roseovarius sp. BRH_c41]